MTTSGSIDFTQDRNKVIAAALRIIGSPTTQADKYADASAALNMMLRHWSVQGIKVWKEARATLFLQVGKASYSLGPSGDPCSETVVETTVAADYASGTSITLTSTAGLTAGDAIGVVLDSGSLEWTTIATVGTPLTLSAGLSGAASTGNAVFTYTSLIERPLELKEARWHDADHERPIWLKSRDEYFELNNKDATGKPIQVYYQPTLTNGTLHVWPAPDVVTDQIKFTFRTTIEDLDGPTNTFDLPAEWLRAIKWNLAAELAPEYGVPMDRQSLIEAKAGQYLNDVESWDQGHTSVFFAPSRY